MNRRLVPAVVGLSMLTLTACGTLTGAGVGAAGGAAIGYGTGYGAGKGALIGTGVRAAAKPRETPPLLNRRGPMLSLL